MTFVLGLAQCRHPENGGMEAVLEMAEQWCAEASLRGVDILVFPESLMTRYELDKRSFASEAESIDGPFCCGMNALAARYGLWLVYTVNERNDEGNPFNTAVITGSDGVKRGVYRKVHLFDTDFTKESDRMAAALRCSSPLILPLGASVFRFAMICVFRKWRALRQRMGAIC